MDKLYLNFRFRFFHILFLILFASFNINSSFVLKTLEKTLKFITDDKIPSKIAIIPNVPILIGSALISASLISIFAFNLKNDYKQAKSKKEKMHTLGWASLKSLAFIIDIIGFYLSYKYTTKSFNTSKSSMLRTIFHPILLYKMLLSTKFLPTLFSLERSNSIFRGI